MVLNISSWWQGLEVFEKTFWAIALLFSALFLLQAILSLFGGDGSEDFDAVGDTDEFVDADHGIGYQFFTIKNMVAFFTLFGWTGIAAYNSGIGKGLSVILAIAAGCAMVLVMAFLLKNVGRLKESGTMQIKNALNQVGNVYLFIPAARKGKGKVHVRVQGSLHELDAITDDIADIATGSMIKVTGIIDEGVLLVTAKFS